VTLRGFATVNFWADDVDAAVAWYRELLGVEPFFTRPGPRGRLAYAKFRAGDYQFELAIADRSFVPPGTAAGPGGAVVHWQVDEVAGTLAKLLSMGAELYQPLVPHGPVATAAVADPFGNIIGLIYNPHYLEVLSALTGQPLVITGHGVAEPAVDLRAVQEPA
jgi:catechol 2,3-dioxygenase-like lactoylglutathione lyase family enzyme